MKNVIETAVVVIAAYTLVNCVCKKPEPKPLPPKKPCKCFYRRYEVPAPCPCEGGRDDYLR